MSEFSQKVSARQSYWIARVQAIRALGRHLVRVIWSMIANNRDYQLKTKTD